MLSKAHSALTELGYRLATAAIRNQPGENYHDGYKKHKELFIKLITLERATTRAIRTFQIEQSNRLDRLVDWNAFALGEAKLDKAALDQERQALEDLLFDKMIRAAALGIGYGEKQLSIPSELSHHDSKVQKAIRKRAAFAAKKITQTLGRRLLAKIKPVLPAKAAIPIDDEDLESDLTDVVDDKSKGDQISATEILGALMIGLFLYAKSQDVETMKTWRTQEDDKVEEICQDLDGQTVPIDEQFDSMVGDIDGPPDAHIYCRCYVELSVA